jgi:uncharacterized protein (TIGR03084 family)
MTDDPDDPLVALESIQGELERLLRRLAPGQWTLPTPAPGWSVRDQVAHLADTEEIAHDTVIGGPRAFAAVVAAHRDAESVTEAGCRRGRELDFDRLLAWWSTAARRTRTLLCGLSADARIPWGLGMGRADFVRARLMEHWAHGLDIRAALPVSDDVSDDEAALPHVAVLGYRTLPYALARAGIARRSGHTLRMVLTRSSGDLLELGPADATDLLTGPLDSWCRVAVRRARSGDHRRLTASGPLAELARDHARAYL